MSWHTVRAAARRLGVGLVGGALASVALQLGVPPECQAAVVRALDLALSVL